MSSAGKSALEYCKSIYASAGAEHLPDTQIWLTAVPGDAARDRGMMSGADQRAVETDDDVIEFVNEWTGKRNIYHKAARFDFDAPGPRIVNTRVFGFAWLDIDLVAKPAVAPQKLIDMACDALDKLTHKPSVINATGGGVQALFHFDEPLVVGTTVEVDGKLVQAHILVENIGRELARIFAGDVAVCHPAGGLRLPFTQNVNRAGGVARTLRVEPDRVCKAVDLYAELRTLGVVLAKTKDGSWSVVTGALSKAANVHAKEARNGGLASGGEYAAKTPEEWEEIIDAMVVKGGRDVATTAYAGKLVRQGMSDDEAHENIKARIVEASARIRAGGGQPEPLGRSTIMAKIRSVRKKHERSQPLGSGQAEKRAPVNSIGARVPDAEGAGVPPDATEPVSMDKVDTGFGLDPGNFFAPGGDTPEPGQAGHSGENNSGGGDAAGNGAKLRVDIPPDYDPSNRVQALRDAVTAWYDKTNKKGDHANKGKEYPYHTALRVPLVLDAFLWVLRQNGRGVARHNGEWRLHRAGDGLWHHVDVLDVCTLFQEFWQGATGMTGTAGRIMDTVATLGILPETTPGDDAWNHALHQGNHVTLFACGTLLTITPDGAVATRRARADDYLTPEQCPRLAASWVPAATAPQTEAALVRVFGWLLPAERAARVGTLLAWASQVLLPGMRPKKTYRAAVFFGESDTGKSVLLNVPRAVLDDPNMPGTAVCTMPLSALDSPFGLSGLLGKRAWLMNEVRTSNRLLADDLLKQIITNEPLTVPVKYRPDVHTQPGVLVGVATNALPKMDDVSDGTVSRLAYFETRIRFRAGAGANATGGEQEMIPDLYRIMVSERDGIAQLLVRTACAMVRAGEMPMSTTMLDETNATYGAEDAVWTFVGQGVQKEATKDHWVSNSNLKRAYRGMVEAEEGADMARKVDMRWVERRLFAKLRFKHDAERNQNRVGGSIPLPSHRGVWLTTKGVEWLQTGLRRDDGQNSKPLSDYRLVAERANQAAPGVVPAAGVPGVVPAANVVPLRGTGGV